MYVYSLIIWLDKHETGSNISNDNSRKGIPKVFWGMTVD